MPPQTAVHRQRNTSKHRALRIVTAAWRLLRHCKRQRAQDTLGALMNPGSRLQNLKTGWRRPPAAPAAQAAEAGCQTPQSRRGRRSAPGVLPARQGPQSIVTLLAALRGGPARGTQPSMSATCAGLPHGSAAQALLVLLVLLSAARVWADAGTAVAQRMSLPTIIPASKPSYSTGGLTAETHLPTIIPASKPSHSTGGLTAEMQTPPPPPLQRSSQLQPRRAALRRQSPHRGTKWNLTKRVRAGSAGSTCIGGAAAPGGGSGAAAGAEKLGWNAGSGACCAPFAPCRAAEYAAVNVLHAAAGPPSPLTPRKRTARRPRYLCLPHYIYIVVNAAPNRPAFQPPSE